MQAWRSPPHGGSVSPVTIFLTSTGFHKGCRGQEAFLKGAPRWWGDTCNSVSQLIFECRKLLFQSGNGNAHRHYSYIGRWASVCCRGRSRTSTGTLAAAQDCRGRYPQPTGGQPQSVRTSADRRYAVFIRNPPPPRQEGMSAKISSPHSVKSRDLFRSTIQN